MREMLERGRDVFYYVTVGNENQPQPALPAGVRDDLLAGAYRLRAAPALPAGAPVATLMASGALVSEALAASDLLAAEFGVAAEVLSVTSWSELAREGVAGERRSRLAGDGGVAHVTRLLAGGDAPVVAVSDYVRAVPESIRAFVPAPRSYTVLGTDGFGRSDTRAALRAFFEVDRGHVVLAVLRALARRGAVPADAPQAAIARFGIDPHAAPPWER
jgi:pyruvate dehydrogenase E1 component